MKIKNFFYFLIYVLAFVILAGTILVALPASIIPAKFMEILVRYVLPYSGIGISALFGCVYLFGKNPLKMLLFFIHMILVAGVVFAVFFSDVFAKIVALF